MTIEPRIWKAGGLAIAATIIFAFVAFRIAARVDSRGAFTRIIPQVVAGSRDGGVTRYSTAIEIVNTTAQSVSISAAFFNEGNGTPATLGMKTTSNALPEFTGSFSNLALPANSLLVIMTDTGQETHTAYTGLWCKLTSTAELTIGATFEERDAANMLLARADIDVSDADMKKFVIPRVWNATSRLDTGFAVVNTGLTDANLRITLRDSSGILGTPRTLEFVPGEKKALYAMSLFGETGESASTQYQYLVFESELPQFAAAGLYLEAGNLASAPVRRLE